MSRHDQQRVLVAGLILIGLGLLFLLNNWLPAWSVWNFIIKCWPVVLILIGVRSLYLYFTYTPPVTVPPPLHDRPSAPQTETNFPPNG